MLCWHVYLPAQKVPCLLRKISFYYGTQKSRLIICVPRHLYPVQTVTFSFHNIHFNIIIPSALMFHKTFSFSPLQFWPCHCAELRSTPQCCMEKVSMTLLNFVLDGDIWAAPCPDVEWTSSNHYIWELYFQNSVFTFRRTCLPAEQRLLWVRGPPKGQNIIIFVVGTLRQDSFF
jgi:hypothetical protein